MESENLPVDVVDVDIARFAMFRVAAMNGEQAETVQSTSLSVLSQRVSS
jgi:hypothetical protein